MLLTLAPMINPNICEPPYLKKALSYIEHELSDDYHFIISRTNSPEETEQFRKCIIPGKKNIFLNMSDEFFVQPKFLDQLFLVFRTCNIRSCYDNKKIFPIPLGYSCGFRYDYNTDDYKTFEQPKKSLIEREYDFCFSGQRAPVRESCFNAMDRIKNDFKTKINTTAFFGMGLKLSDYYAMLQNTKISIVPHGAVLFESFRYFESFESNNIVITSYPMRNPEYAHWYYDGSPAIVLNDWSELTKELVTNLLRSESLAEYEIKNKEYFENRVSAKAVGTFILDKIRNAEK